MIGKNIKYKVFDYIEDRDRLKGEISVLLEELKEVEHTITSICHHPEEYLTEESQYYPGGYLNVDYTEYWLRCNLCGQRGDIITKYHGHYG